MSLARWVAIVWVGLACAPPADPVHPFEPAEELAAAEVEAVVFFVGDAGDAAREESSLLQALRGEVEAWSEGLSSEGAVSVVYLGDIVYPEGVHDRGHRDFPRDSARLHGQVWVVDGPSARRHGTRGVFLPGNHDWGNMAGASGVARLHNLNAMLRTFAAAGTAVSLVPAPGEPGPERLEITDDVSILAIDSNWWLQADDADERQRSFAGLAAALEAAAPDLTIVAAHHPYRTSGAHSGLLGPTVDPYWILRRTGSVLQSVTSEPYESMLLGLARVFAGAGPPFLFVAGHDHSLQLFEGRAPGDPDWSVVSGAASKLSAVADQPDLVWGSRTAGYARLVIARNGRVFLFMDAAPEISDSCPETGTTLCQQSGAPLAPRTVFSKRLR